jgi:hypothetical protein
MRQYQVYSIVNTCETYIRAYGERYEKGGVQRSPGDKTIVVRGMFSREVTVRVFY